MIKCLLLADVPGRISGKSAEWSSLLLKGEGLLLFGLVAAYSASPIMLRLVDIDPSTARRNAHAALFHRSRCFVSQPSPLILHPSLIDCSSAAGCRSPGIQHARPFHSEAPYVSSGSVARRFGIL